METNQANMGELEVKVDYSDFKRLKVGKPFKLPDDVISVNDISYGKVHDYRYVRFFTDTKSRYYDFEGVTPNLEVLLGDKKR